MSKYDPEYIVDTLYGKAGGADQFSQRLGQVIGKAIDFVLDGEESLDALEGCEKTFIGTKTEKLFLKEFALPSKKAHRPKLDTVVAGVDLDLKFTLGSNWMIPPEAVDEWCLVIKADTTAKTYNAGILQMTDDNLTRGGNRDGKRSVCKFGKTNIRWMAENKPIVSNILGDRNG
jgi:hypothetical protein